MYYTDENRIKSQFFIKIKNKHNGLFQCVRIRSKCANLHGANMEKLAG